MAKQILRNQKYNNIIFYLGSFILGLTLTLSFYPISLFPFCISLGLFSFVLMRYNDSSKLFLNGMFFGYGYFLINVNWIPLSIYKAHIGIDWLVPFLRIIIPLPFAIFTGLFSIFTKYAKYNNTIFVINFSFLWVIFEYIRSNIFFPFTWAILGYSAISLPWFSQILSCVGGYGASLLIAILSTSFFSQNKKYIILITIIFLTICLVGKIYRETIEIDKSFDNIKIRLIQPNVQDFHFGNPQKQFRIFQELAKLTLSSNFEKQNYIFWPEAAFPYPIFEDSNWVDIIKKLIPVNHNSAIILGADRVEILNNRVFSFNSILAVNNKYNILGYYDKRILVPFGEYIPYKENFLFIKKLAHSIGIENISKGKKDNIINLSNGVKFLPIICSESTVDKGYLKTFDYSEYRFILSVSNDAWFADSFGPYQHFGVLIVRAIEYGLPVIRVANSGISGIINIFGDIVESTKINEQNVVDSVIPSKLRKPTLFYRIYNFIIPVIFTLYFIFLTFICAYTFFIFKKKNK